MKLENSLGKDVEYLVSQTIRVERNRTVEIARRKHLALLNAKKDPCPDRQGSILC